MLDFCNSDLSAFYFDVRKDSLYCDAPTSLDRRACRTVMDYTLQCLISWVAPILCFTADEAWLAYTGDETDSIHLHTYFNVPENWRDQTVAERWSRIRNLRSEVMIALEAARSDGAIGGGLSAEVKMTASQDTAELLKGVDLASLLITSSVELDIAETPDLQIAVRRADGGKCARCWKVFSYLPVENEQAICSRCETVLAGQTGD